jgi:alpha-D-ribose 1-methylphosphonate 5-triphosphate synthase subunit PhnI
MYVAVKGGEAAIAAAHELLARERRGDSAVPEITPEQIREQLTLAVNRVMCEGSLYDPDLAALAIKQARGDMIEAIFLLRAYRTTLPRLGYGVPLDTNAMEIRRRISATFKDLPGGQVLGPTFDYTHRLLDPALAAVSDPASIGVRPLPTTPEQDANAGGEGSDPDHAPPGSNGPRGTGSDPQGPIPPEEPAPHVSVLLERAGLVEHNPEVGQGPVSDITRDPIAFPVDRDARLQALARGDEGFLLALGYSTQRGYGRTHPFAGEIRMGEVEVSFVPEELGFEVPLGRITVTECEMVNQFKGSETAPPQFTRGYGLAFGHSERKAMSMALVDRALRAKDLGEEATALAQDEEFVLSHSDNVQATGFVEHLKLPHYVDFQAELALLRQLRAEWAERHAGTAEPAAAQAAPQRGPAPKAASRAEAAE